MWGYFKYMRVCESLLSTIDRPLPVQKNTVTRIGELKETRPAGGSSFT
jgi:hypothetical protein